MTRVKTMPLGGTTGRGEKIAKPTIETRLSLCRSALGDGAGGRGELVSLRPDPSADQSFIAPARQASAPGLKVSIVALGAEESRRSFGEPLAEYGIQPIWLAIE